MMVQGNRRSGFRSAWRSVIPAVVLLAAACGDDTTAPSTSLLGTWDLVGYSDSGIAAVTTGTVVFRADHIVSFDGTVTFPGEPPDQLLVEGTWSQSGNVVSLTLGGTTSNWSITEEGDQVTLTHDGPAPANTITLSR